jgi:hypothetical protein
VDRFADKYFSLTSYQYGANNPIKYIDVNGDSIRVSIDGQQDVVYLRGKFYSMDAKTGKYKIYRNEAGSFGDKVLKALNAIYNGGNSGRELINYFQGSFDKNITIKYGEGNEERSGLISFNPDQQLSDIPNQDGSFGRPAFIGLAHEMGHTWDRYNDNEHENLWYNIELANGKVKEVTNSEKVATWWENRIRSENGIGLREFYSFMTQADGRVVGDERGRLLIEGTRNSKWQTQSHTFSLPSLHHTKTPHVKGVREITHKGSYAY